MRQAQIHRSGKACMQHPDATNETIFWGTNFLDKEAEITGQRWWAQQGLNL
ncbi:hypothetical protein [Acetobacter persici]|uniref:hypothetical protein n=1 Tax=Acetobacter persici TaxID=1076596 RepID=UPI001BA5EE7A|nr:hypothetical protein [Acetobacter persici]MBS0963364.1 hypothetical protein [Acetobacter persici]